MNDVKIIGCLIEATAPRRRTLRGVVLPPASRARTSALRIAVDGRAPVRFDPAQWTVTVLAGPVYNHDTVPATLLATRTMLKTEQRRQPAPGQSAIAEYKLYKGTALLYAVADTVPMTELSAKRAEAWVKTRTCVRCGQQRPRPLLESPEGDRYCGACHVTTAHERWAEQARQAQSEAVEWAREVLADPRTVLLTNDPDPIGSIGRFYRAETIAGDVLADVHVRTWDSYDAVTYPSNWTPEQIAERKAREMDGTIGPTEWKALAATLADRRFIMWRSNWGRPCLPADIVDVRIPNTDELHERLALWSAWMPDVQYSYWYPEPKQPWHYSSAHPRYKGHEALRQRPRDLAAEIADMRSLLHRMADGPAPEPTIGHRPKDAP